MAESRIWALVGLVLVVAAVLLILPETLAALGGGEGGIGLVVYGVGVLVAAAVTVAVVLPSLLRSRPA
ncbi:MAG: hypothetical protein ABEJ22_02525 [Haloferacaceae archaeon]